MQQLDIGFVGPLPAPFVIRVHDRFDPGDVMYAQGVAYFMGSDMEEVPLVKGESRGGGAPCGYRFVGGGVTIHIPASGSLGVEIHPGRGGCSAAKYRPAKDQVILLNRLFPPKREVGALGDPLKPYLLVAFPRPLCKRSVDDPSFGVGPLLLACVIERDLDIPSYPLAVATVPIPFKVGGLGMGQEDQDE